MLDPVNAGCKKHNGSISVAPASTEWMKPSYTEGWRLGDRYRVRGPFLLGYAIVTWLIRVQKPGVTVVIIVDLGSLATLLFTGAPFVLSGKNLRPDGCLVMVQRFGGGLAGACPLTAGEGVASGTTPNPGSMRASDPNLW
jgi:hypothetical protein